MRNHRWHVAGKWIDALLMYDNVNSALSQMIYSSAVSSIWPFELLVWNVVHLRWIVEQCQFLNMLLGRWEKRANWSSLSSFPLAMQKFVRKLIKKNFQLMSWSNHSNYLFTWDWWDESGRKVWSFKKFKSQFASFFFSSKSRVSPSFLILVFFCLLKFQTSRILASLNSLSKWWCGVLLRSSFSLLAGLMDGWKVKKQQILKHFEL